MPFCDACESQIEIPDRFCKNCGKQVIVVADQVFPADEAGSNIQISGLTCPRTSTEVQRSRSTSNAIIRSLLGSLVGIGFVTGLTVLIWQYHPSLASIFVMCVSCVPLIFTYRKSWPVGLVTCFAPVVVTITGVCTFGHVILSGHEFSEVLSFAIVFTGTGLLLGTFRGIFYPMIVRDRTVLAGRRWFMLSVWLFAYLALHLGVLASPHTATVDIGLFTLDWFENGLVPKPILGFQLMTLTTAMIAMSSLVLFLRYRRRQSAMNSLVQYEPALAALRSTESAS